MGGLFSKRKRKGPFKRRKGPLEIDSIRLRRTQLINEILSSPSLHVTHPDRPETRTGSDENDFENDTGSDQEQLADVYAERSAFNRSAVWSYNSGTPSVAPGSYVHYAASSRQDSRSFELSDIGAYNVQDLDRHLNSDASDSAVNLSEGSNEDIHVPIVDDDYIWPIYTITPFYWTSGTEPLDYMAVDESEVGPMDDGRNDLVHASSAAQAEHVAQLPTKAYVSSRSSQGTTCQICLEVYSRGDVLKTLPCFHDYHDACIDEWLMNNFTCPICRTEVETEGE